MVSARVGGARPGAIVLLFSIVFTASASTFGVSSALAQTAGLAAVQTAPTQDQNPLGATVFSKDGQLAGAVDQIDGDRLIVGLAGYLGQGEKDVAIPAKGLSVTSSHQLPRYSVDGQFGGGNITRITVPMSLSELIAAPAYKQPAAQTGVPSSHVGTPAETPAKPPSSTQSGGPG